MVRRQVVTEEAQQLIQLFGEGVLLHHLPRAPQGKSGPAVRPRCTSNTQVDTSGMQCLQHCEALRHAQRAVVRQHHTPAAHTYTRCSGCHVGDHDLGEHAHQPFVVMVFGKPVTVITCLLRQEGDLGGVVQHLAGRAVIPGEIGEIEYGEFHFLHRHIVLFIKDRTISVMFCSSTVSCLELIHIFVMINSDRIHLKTDTPEPR